MGIHDWLGLLFAGIGAVALFYGRQVRTKAEDSKLWPSVPGTVKQSTLKLQSSGGYPINSSTYKAVVQYKYKVASRYYTNDKICIGGQ